MERWLGQPRWTSGTSSPAYQVGWQNNSTHPPFLVFKPSREIPPCAAIKPARAALRFVLFQAYLRFQTIITVDILFPSSNGVTQGLGCLQRLLTHAGHVSCLQCLILPLPLPLHLKPVVLIPGAMNEMQQRWTRNNETLLSRNWRLSVKFRDHRLCKDLNTTFQVQRPVEESTGQSIPNTFLNSDTTAELNQCLSISPIKFAPAQQYDGEGRKSKAR